ncbi:ABC-type nitrate/sulfonate/bicarbonate transport system permease component [Arthrobacter globiformis]|uniref:ABC transporter permease n=1 Tax=Arthrobacter globiformis TaxID=1665 RepID=UPI00278AA88F|nr:ABC transporter permease [Arthrobacter globiformis]MDQ1060830.1 ABC-type nitrate/sulfonate/bicarbonate transport system permease component [Arthrobacter globiformis]
MARQLIRYGRKGSGALTIAVALAAWEFGSQTGLLPSSVFPSMTSTVQALVTLLGDPGFWQALGDTMMSWVIGVLIAAAAGIPLGMLLGRIGFLYRSTRLLIDFLSTIPSVSVIPVILLLFGATMEMKVVLIVYGAFWPILVQTAYGVRDTDRVLLDTARSYSFTPARSVFSILMPSALPFIVTGLRISAIIGLLLAVSSEVLGSAPGIGMEMVMAQTGGALAPTYAYVLLIGLVGIAAYLGLNYMSRRVLFWHPSVRGISA